MDLTFALFLPRGSVAGVASPFVTRASIAFMRRCSLWACSRRICPISCCRSAVVGPLGELVGVEGVDVIVQALLGIGGVIQISPFLMTYHLAYIWITPLRPVRTVAPTPLGFYHCYYGTRVSLPGSSTHTAHRRATSVWEQISVCSLSEWE